MFLAANGIGFADENRQLVINIFERGQAKAMNVIARCRRFDAKKARMLDFALEPHAAFNPILLDRGAGKTQAHLKDDARLLSIYRYRPAFLHERQIAIEYFA